MQPQAAAPQLRNGNGHGRAITAVVRKRNGQEVLFDRAKIAKAVSRCLLNSCDWTDSPETRQVVEQTTTQVEHLLLYLAPPITVEKIQDLVEQQLMALGYYDAAKQYILYREEHRKLREERPVDEAVKEAFEQGCRYFQGENRHVQIFQALDKFARFHYAAGRREVWPETVDRVMNYAVGHMAQHYPGAVGPQVWDELRRGLLHLEAAPSMRMIQMAGPALDRCQSGVYNCAYQALTEPRDLAEEMYLLCQGCGVGFSVEQQYVNKWPRIKRQRKGVAPEVFVVPDTTEGWCDALKLGMERWLEGYDVAYNYDLVRPAGAILRIKGGRASGPQPLKDCLTFTRNLILSRQRDWLRSIDLYDIACYVHRISGVGGVRRASGISLSDLDDEDMRHAKSGQFWNDNPQRNQANNSAVYEERPSPLEFLEEWMAMARSGSGERGIFNRGSLKTQFPKRRKHRGFTFGMNPCGEIWLRNKGFCNLSIGVLRRGLDWTEVCRRVVLATIWGTIQSTMTRFSYIGPEWQKNCEEERLLGVDLLGHMDYPELQPGAPQLAQRLAELKELASQTNVRWAQQLGINPSAAVTCGKPSGDSSVFFDCAPGFKAWHGEYFLRRCRVQAENPVGKMLKDQGVPSHVDYDKSGLLVLEFPCRAPEGALVLGGRSAVEQLEHWKQFKLHYTEHNPSVTIYVKDEEWLAVGHWVYENWDIVGGLSFLPYDGGVYPLAPYETITAEEYQQRMATFPEIDWSRIVRYEAEDMTTASQTYACTGGACELG